MVGPRLQLAPVGMAASGTLAIQLVAARYAHGQLASDDIRDVKLVVLLMEFESGRLSGRFAVPGLVPYAADVLGRLAQLGGISRARVGAAVSRLLEAGALTVQERPDPHLLFVERLLQPLGAAEYLEWPAVVDSIRGHTPALLVLRGLLDSFRQPWEWASVTYQDLGERCCYSLGMVRHGIDQLIDAGVLERRVHVGRGHEYRCSSWALGSGSSSPVAKAAATVQPQRPVALPPRVVPSGDDRATQPAVVSMPSASAMGETIVEIGDVVVRVPPGTVIRMEVTADGAAVYHVGSHLRLTQPPGS